MLFHRAVPGLKRGSNVRTLYRESPPRDLYARHEASIFGSPSIGTEHLLLGLLRENKPLIGRILPAEGSDESLRKQMEAQLIRREPIPTSVDLPVSNELKRVMAYAAEAADQMGHKHIGPEHLLLGLLRKEKSLSAVLLQEQGMELQAMRKEVENWATQHHQ